MTPTGIINPAEQEEGERASGRNAGRPTRHAAAALPDRILDAAQELFLSQGFEATSLNQIAAKAAATKRTLYVKVGDKADLFAAVVRRMLNERRQRLRRAGATGSLNARLTRFGEDLLAIGLDPDVLRLYRLIVAEAPRFPALANLMEEELTHGARRHLADLLHDEVERGRLHLPEVETAAQLFVAMVLGPPQQAALFGLKPWNRMRRSAWVAAAVGLFLDGGGSAKDP
ncbi:MAG TPA: TetR/AcrR family transcriptional regulator [Rhodopila sp.]|nr:TetR/AcrR family transcriptional regulator [Rhodopila sp.]